MRAVSNRLRWADVKPLPCVAQSGKKIIAVELPGTRRARVVREIARCICPIARWRARPAASGTDAEPLSCVAQSGKRIIAVEPPGARRARVVRCIRSIARAASTACGFRPSLVDGGGAFAVSRAAGKVRDTRDGVLRLRHIRPVARAGGIRGGECGLRLQAVTNGRTRSLIVRRAAGEENRRSGTARNAPGEGGM